MWFPRAGVVVGGLSDHYMRAKPSTLLALLAGLLFLFHPTSFPFAGCERWQGCLVGAL